VPIRGPDDEFTGLFHAHFERVYVNLRRLGVPEAAVDDALQEVFVVVLRRRAAASIMCERAWILGVVRRIAHRWRRAAARQRRLAEALTHEPREPLDGAAAAAKYQAARMLEQFLDGLGDDKRAVFVLAELEQLTAPEIAEALQLNINTVYSRLRSARQAFDRSFARARLRDARVTGDPTTPAVLLSHARTAYTPAPAAQARALALLVPLLLTGGVAHASAARTLASTSSLAGKAAPWTAALGLAAFLATDVGAPAPDTPPPPRPTAAPAASTVAPRPSPVPAVAVDPPLHLPPPASPRSSYVQRSAPPPEVDDPLGREAALLASARAALREGDPSTAHALLERHAREHPTGVLVDERRLSQISTLCLMGQVDEARAAADRLARDRPATAERAASLCPEPVAPPIENTSTGAPRPGD